MAQTSKQKLWPENVQPIERSMKVEDSIERLEFELNKLRRNHEATKIILAETQRSREQVLLENEILYQEKAQAEKDARIDTLTGLPNLRSYDETIAKEIERTKREGHPLTLMMIDIDDFKKINDTEGHDVGDLVIQRLGNLVSQNLRSGDTIARIGGEEFVIILPNTNLEDAKVVANKLVRAIEVESETPASPKFTISGGYAQWNEGVESAHVLREVADRALNEAKLKGKNRMLPFEEGRKIEKSELMAQAVRHIKRSMPKDLSKSDKLKIIGDLLSEFQKEEDE